MTLAFISVRLPCYVVGLVAVDVWRYDAASTRSPSGISRRFLPSAVQGYSVAQAGWTTDRMGREITPRCSLSPLGALVGLSFWLSQRTFELDGRRKGKTLKRESGVGSESRSRRGADVLRPGLLLVYRFVICPAVEAPRRP